MNGENNTVCQTLNLRDIETFIKMYSNNHSLSLDLRLKYPTEFFFDSITGKIENIKVKKLMDSFLD
jgi:hypothetical protein